MAVADQAGLTMTQLGLGFVDRHPAISSTIIGPKTPAQLDDLLGAADVELDDATMDAIDAIVPPGTDAPGTEHYVENPALEVTALRR